MALLLTGVIGVAVVGYFVGINDGVPREGVHPPTAQSIDLLGPAHDSLTGSDLVSSQSAAVIPSASYPEMRRAEFSAAHLAKPSLQRVDPASEFQRCITCHEPDSPVVITDERAKLRSLAERSSRRAFNGAPPVIPHAIARTDDAACVVCHGDGAIIGQLVANSMSHGLLTNCLQCHAAPPPQPFAHLEQAAENSFVGLPAPTSGAREYSDSPPVIPHSTWMRERCLSCHGGATGWPGLAVTHHWRTNCMQCHATTATLEQVAVAASFQDEGPADLLRIPSRLR